MIALFDKNTGEKLAYLDGIIIEDSLSITQQLNGEFTLRFETLQALELCTEGYVAIEDKYFDVVYVEQEHSKSLKYRIEAEHVSYRLLNEVLDYYTFDGTPAEILQDIIKDTEFSLGEVDFETIITFAVHEEVSRLGLVKLLANEIGAKLKFEAFTISLKEEAGLDRGYVARFGKNIKTIKKIFDNRKDSIYYIVDLIELKKNELYKGFEELERLETGDKIKVIDEALGINIENIVLKRTFNPIREVNSVIELSNSLELVTDSITKIIRNSVAKGKLYHGIRISPEAGFECIRNDNLARGVFNSDSFSFQAGDGSGENWENRLYFDPLNKTYVFDGTLSAGAIEAIKAQIDVVISNTVIVQALSANEANVAKLTVDSLDTSRKVQKYLQQDKSDTNYIRIKEQYVEFVTAEYVGDALGVVQEEQALNRDNESLFWQDETFAASTTEETQYPVMIYKYKEMVKMSYAFEDVEGIYRPHIVLGSGWGEETFPERGKFYIDKDLEGGLLKYITSTGEEYSIHIGENGILFGGQDRLSELEFYANGFIAKYGKETVGYRWTKDLEGKITQLENLFSEDDVVVSWSGGNI